MDQYPDQIKPLNDAIKMMKISQKEKDSKLMEFGAKNEFL